ncbi:hypothetical protein ALC57_15842, partial [Trachymyrmex cornetzi]
ESILSRAEYVTGTRATICALTIISNILDNDKAARPIPAARVIAPQRQHNAANTKTSIRSEPKLLCRERLLGPTPFLHTTIQPAVGSMYHTSRIKHEHDPRVRMAHPRSGFAKGIKRAGHLKPRVDSQNEAGGREEKMTTVVIVSYAGPRGPYKSTVRDNARGLHIVVYIYASRHKSSFKSHSAGVR